MSQSKQFLQVKINELNGACMWWWRALRRTMESFGWPSSVYCPQGILNPRPHSILFNRLIPSVFHKTFSKYTPKNSFKKRFLYMSRAKYVHFLVCKLPNWISTLDSLHNPRLHFYFKIYSLKDISNFRYSNQFFVVFINKSKCTIMQNMTFPVIICRTKMIFNTKERNFEFIHYIYTSWWV